MSTRNDAAIKAVLEGSAVRFTEAGEYSITDEAGSFILRGGFEFSALAASVTDDIRVQIHDGTGGLGYVRFEIEWDGTTTLGSLNATTSGAGISVTAEDYYLSDNGAVINFALDVTLPAPGGSGDGTWSLQIDPSIEDSGIEYLTFRHLSIDKKI